METSVFSLILLLQYHVISQSVMAAGTMDDINSLKSQLFSNYSRELRPVYNLSDEVVIDTLFSLLSILDFDEASGTLTMSCLMTLSWIDFRLAWNSSEFGGIVQHGFSSALVWKPSIVLISSAEELRDFGSDKFDVRVSSNGTVVFSPGKVVRTACTIDMTSFPSDSHLCTVVVAPWLYTKYEVRLRPNLSEISMIYFSPNKEWEIDRTFVEEAKTYSTYSTVISHDIYLTRKPRYFMISLASPIILLCFLNPFVFLLPVSSGERISFAVTIFLSLAVYMSYIGQELMPKVSDPMSGVSYFLVISICFSSCLIILTVLRLHYVDVQGVQKLPCWLFVFAKCWICKGKCSKRNRIGTNQSSTGDVIEIVDDATTKENQVDMDSDKDDIEHVLRFIDKSLFWITEILIIMVEIIVLLVFRIETGI